MVRIRNDREAPTRGACRREACRKEAMVKVLVVSEIIVFCGICGSLCPSGQVTCTEKCHEILIERLERVFGIHKKVTDLETGKIYRVPTRDIIEGGLKRQDLKYFPEWKIEGLRAR
jgi:Fe-S-cluster-containing hydrogenase component 2